MKVGKVAITAAEKACTSNKNSSVQQLQWCFVPCSWSRTDLTVLDSKTDSFTIFRYMWDLARMALVITTVTRKLASFFNVAITPDNLAVGHFVSVLRLPSLII